MYYRGVDIEKLQSFIFFNFKQWLSEDCLIRKIEDNSGFVYKKGRYVFIPYSNNLDEYIILCIAKPLQKNVVFFKRKTVKQCIILFYIYIRYTYWRLLKLSRKLLITR